MRPESDTDDRRMDVTELSVALQLADRPTVVDVREPDEFISGLMSSISL